MSVISESSQKIRDLINEIPRLKQVLVSCGDNKWDMLCSSLDMVSDTDHGIDRYMEMNEPKDLGEKYLLVFGALQLMVVQQDAVRNLVRGLHDWDLFSPDFRVEEFTTQLPLDGLINALNSNGFTVNGDKDKVDALNRLLNMPELLNMPDLFDKLTAKFNNMEPSAALTMAYEDYIVKKENPDALKKLNRLALEEFYPQKTPKSYIDKLQSIRDDRNMSIGHPTHADRYKNNAYNYIVQASLSSRHFELYSYSGGGGLSTKDIYIPDLIDKQRVILAKYLNDALNKLVADENAHRERYSVKKLADIFNGYDYEIGKIPELIGQQQLQVANYHLKFIIDRIDKFKEALEERKESDASQSITYYLNELGYPLDEVRDFLTGTSARLNEKDMEIFLFYVRDCISSLFKIAKELDETYGQKLA